jgi:hypothetical protein
VVIGRYHTWFQNAFGDFLAGEWNTAVLYGHVLARVTRMKLPGVYDSIVGGSNNVIVTQDRVSILGGIDDSPKWMVIPQYYP